MCIDKYAYACLHLLLEQGETQKRKQQVLCCLAATTMTFEKGNTVSDHYNRLSCCAGKWDKMRSKGSFACGTCYQRRLTQALSLHREWEKFLRPVSASGWAASLFSRASTSCSMGPVHTSSLFSLAYCRLSYTCTKHEASTGIPASIIGPRNQSFSFSHHLASLQSTLCMLREVNKSHSDSMLHLVPLASICGIV